MLLMGERGTMFTVALLTPDDSETEAFQRIGQLMKIHIERIKVINDFFDKPYAGLWYYSYPLDHKLIDTLASFNIKSLIVFLDKRERAQRKINSRFDKVYIRLRIYPVDVDEFSEYLSASNYWNGQ